MKNITVESYSDATNAAIIRLPERRFPGMVIQGDSLHNLRASVIEIEQFAERIPDDDLRSAVTCLREDLDLRVQHYEQVLAEHHISLPY